MQADAPDISFVVIGYNEAATLGPCLESVRGADLAGLSHELLYVDAGSHDNSRYIAEVAARCRRTPDPLWLKEAVAHALWAAAILVALALLALGSGWARLLVLLAAAAVLTRKTLQMLGRGYPFSVAAVYAAHTYFSKIPVALGELTWLLSPRGARGRGRSGGEA